MVVPTAGSVILVPFPFSDLSQSKLRPAVVIASVGRGDWILCQVTSSSYSDPGAIVLDTLQFKAGALRTVSYARPGKLFTANQTLIVTQVGQLQSTTVQDIIEAVVSLVRSGMTS